MKLDNNAKSKSNNIVKIYRIDRANLDKYCLLLPMVSAKW